VEFTPVTTAEDIAIQVLLFFWVVVSNIFYFHPYLGKISILTNIFSNGVETTN